MNKFSTLVTAAVVALGLTLSAAPADAAPKVVKVASSVYPGQPIWLAWQDAKKFIEERSNGRFRLDVVDSYGLGPTSTAFQGVQFGTIHLVHDGSPNFTAFDPTMAIFDLPYLFPDYESADAIINGAVGKKILASISKKAGVSALGFIGNNFRVILTNDKIEHVAQCKGVKIRSTPSKAHIAGLKSLGFAPTPMAWSETVTGVQQRVINGFDIDSVSAAVSGFGEIAPYIFISQHMLSPHLLAANTDWWESLNKEDRALFEEMIDLVIKRGTANNRDEEKNAWDLMKKAGHTLSPIAPEEKAEWIKASANVYKEVPQIPASLVEEIQAELKKMGKI